MIATRIGIRDVKAMLCDNIAGLCRQLLPQGKREGRLWVAVNPVTNDGKREGALKIALEGDRGAWKDWRSGDKGDAIDLVAYIERTNRAGALRWAKDWLGIRQMSDADRAALRQRAAASSAREAAREDRRARWKLARANEMFAAAIPIAAGSPADLYFIGRACPLAEVQHPAKKSLRFSPSLEWWKGAVYEDVLGRREKVRPGPSFPAIVAAMRNRDGMLTGVHCTFIAPLSGLDQVALGLRDPDEPPARPGHDVVWRKAPVDAAKLMFGTASGSAIRIADGAAGPLDAARDRPSPLILTEGIENAVTAAIALPEARVWAAASLSGLATAPVDHDAISAVIVAADNDDNATARDHLDRALDELEATGKPVTVIRSFIGNDLNDLARAMA